MRRRRLSDRERGLGPALVWSRMGNGWVHAKVWKRGGEMRECLTPGCLCRFTPLDVCYCGVATAPLQHEA